MGGRGKESRGKEERGKGQGTADSGHGNKGKRAEDGKIRKGKEEGRRGGRKESKKGKREGKKGMRREENEREGKRGKRTRGRGYAARDRDRRRGQTRGRKGVSVPVGDAATIAESRISISNTRTDTQTKGRTHACKHARARPDPPRHAKPLTPSLPLLLLSHSHLPFNCSPSQGLFVASHRPAATMLSPFLPPCPLPLPSSLSLPLPCPLSLPLPSASLSLPLQLHLPLASLIHTRTTAHGQQDNMLHIL